MKVLLKRDVKGLGKAGDVKSVADGYAANYLIPRELAVPATASLLKEFREKQSADARKEAQEKASASHLAERLSKLVLKFTARSGEKGKLYGSITSSDIASGLEMELGQPVDKRKVMLEQPIHELGTYRVPVKLMADLIPEITVVVEGEKE